MTPDHFKTLADELRDGSLLVRNSMLRLLGVLPKPFTDGESALAQASVAHSGTVRACDWCGEPTFSASLCASCQVDQANGCNGPDEVTL